MTKPVPPVITVEQLEEALEERVKPERRHDKKGLPENVHKDRRKGDRRKD